MRMLGLGYGAAGRGSACAISGNDSWTAAIEIASGPVGVDSG